MSKRLTECITESATAKQLTQKIKCRNASLGRGHIYIVWQRGLGCVEAQRVRRSHIDPQTARWSQQGIESKSSSGYQSKFWRVSAWRVPSQPSSLWNIHEFVWAAVYISKDNENHAIQNMGVRKVVATQISSLKNRDHEICGTWRSGGLDEWGLEKLLVPGITGRGKITGKRRGTRNSWESALAKREEDLYRHVLVMKDSSAITENGPQTTQPWESSAQP